jgi:hypothetical protein
MIVSLRVVGTERRGGEQNADPGTPSLAAKVESHQIKRCCSIATKHLW